MSLKRSQFSLVQHRKPISYSEFEATEEETYKGHGEGGPASRTTLNLILPPRIWSDNTGTWVQEVSGSPASRNDVSSLKERLHYKLKQRQARSDGFCPVRRELYQQCFNELIRQTALIFADIGILLAEVRDEIETSIDALTALYESAVAFSVTKNLKAESQEAQQTRRIKELEEKVKKLEIELESQTIFSRREKAELENMFKLKKAQLLAQIESLDNTNKTIKATLQSVLTPSTK